MSKYEYRLEPRTYKTVLRVLDEFYEEMTQQQLNPTLVRLEEYAKKGVNQYAQSQSTKQER